MNARRLRMPFLLRWGWLLVVGGCGGSVPTTPVAFAGAESPPLEIEGLAACAPSQPERLTLRRDEPLAVIVHGCFSSGGAFRSLAEVFAFHGQQTLCFNYDDRDGLRYTAARLRRALEELGRAMPGQQVAILGHSQGGMIARIALSHVGPEGPAAAVRYRMVTVSSPLSGIEAASHCGLYWLHWLSLGITVGVCQAVTGSKWTEIHPYSDYWTEPASLDERVTEHLVVITDEEGTCRRRDEEGECEEDDFVFSTGEQHNARMLADPRTRAVLVPAGHVEIVGEARDHPPHQLIEVLQANGLLRPTPPERRVAFRELLRRVY